MLGASNDFIKGFITIFVFTTCSLVNISSVSTLPFKYLPSFIIRETSENKVKLY